MPVCQDVIKEIYTAADRENTIMTVADFHLFAYRMLCNLRAMAHMPQPIPHTAKRPTEKIIKNA